MASQMHHEHHAHSTETARRSAITSPQEAMAAPPEEFAYVAALHTGTGVDEPDFLAVVDLNPQSDTYSQITHRTPMPGIGDELHHYGWQACSSACHSDIKREHLIVPGFRSSNLHIVDVGTDARRAGDRQSDHRGRAQAEDRSLRTAHRPLHAGRDRHRQHARRCERRRARRLRGSRCQDLRHPRPLGERAERRAVQLRLLVPAAQERDDLQRVGARRTPSRTASISRTWPTASTATPSTSGTWRRSA